MLRFAQKTNDVLLIRRNLLIALEESGSYFTADVLEPGAEHVKRDPCRQSTQLEDEAVASQGLAICRGIAIASQAPRLPEWNRDGRGEQSETELREIGRQMRNQLNRLRSEYRLDDCSMNSWQVAKQKYEKKVHWKKFQNKRSSLAICGIAETKENKMAVKKNLK